MAMNRRATTQDISWFLDLHRNDQLDLNPPYQRRSVWSPKDRRFFLDTIFRGYPSPSIFLHKEITGGKTIYAVVDGKQRLETIINFSKSKIVIDKSFGDTRLNGKKWKDIESDPELSRKFWDYVLPVEFIDVDVDIIEGTAYVNQVFDRLNRNSRKLVEQELRHAKYDGWFISFVEKESEESDWKSLEVVSVTRTKRMRDVQFLSELLIVLLKKNISGFDQDEIDEYYAKYDDILEPDLEIDENEVRNKFTEARKYLLNMEQYDHCITCYAKDFKDFYSLWAIVVLNLDKLPTPQAFAEKYSSFMEKVNLLKNQNNLDEFLKEHSGENYSQHLKYSQNSAGASTEEPQRRERNLVLKSLIIEEISS